MSLRFGLLPIKPVDWDPAITSGLRDYIASRSREVISELSRRMEETDSILRNFDSDLVGRILLPEVVNVHSDHLTLQERMAALVAAWFWEYTYTFRDFLYISGMVFSFYSLNSTFPGAAWSNFTNFSKSLQAIASLDGFPIPMNLDQIVSDDLRPSTRTIPSRITPGQEDILWRIPIPIYGLYPGDSCANTQTSSGDILIETVDIGGGRIRDEVLLEAGNQDIDFTFAQIYPCPPWSPAARAFGWIFDTANYAIYDGITPNILNNGRLAVRIFASIRYALKYTVNYLHRLLAINPIYSAKMNRSNPVNDAFTTSLDDKLMEILEPIKSKLFTGKFNSTNWTKTISALYDNPYDDNDVIKKEMIPLSKPCPVYQTPFQAFSGENLFNSDVLYPDSGRMILGEYWRQNWMISGSPFNRFTTNDIRIWEYEEILLAYYKSLGLQISTASISDRRYWHGQYPNIQLDEIQANIVLRPDITIQSRGTVTSYNTDAPLIGALGLDINFPVQVANDELATLSWALMPTANRIETPRLHQHSGHQRTYSDIDKMASLPDITSAFDRFENVLPFCRPTFSAGNTWGIMSSLTDPFYRLNDVAYGFRGLEWHQMLLNTSNLKTYGWKDYDDLLTTSDSVFVEPKSLMTSVPTETRDVRRFDATSDLDQWLSSDEVSAYIRPLVFRSLRSPRVLTYDVTYLTDYEFDSFFNLGVIGIDIYGFNETDTLGVLTFKRTDFDAGANSTVGYSNEGISYDYYSVIHIGDVWKRYPVFPISWFYHIDNYAYDSTASPTNAPLIKLYATGPYVVPTAPNGGEYELIMHTFRYDPVANATTYDQETLLLKSSRFVKLKLYLDVDKISASNLAVLGVACPETVTTSFGGNSEHFLLHLRTMQMIMPYLFPNSKSVKYSSKSIDLDTTKTGTTDRLIAVIESLYSPSGSYNRYLGLSITNVVKDIDAKAILNRSLPELLGKINRKARFNPKWRSEESKNNGKSNDSNGYNTNKTRSKRRRKKFKTKNYNNTNNSNANIIALNDKKINDTDTPNLKDSVSDNKQLNKKERSDQGG